MVAEPERRQKDVTPLNPSEFHILLALADGSRHGYGIMQEVAERSAGTVRLGPGTLYGALRRMLAAGLIEESGTRPPSPEDDERRRCYYCLTDRGRCLAVQEAERLAALVRVAEEKHLVRRRNPAIVGGA